MLVVSTENLNIVGANLTSINVNDGVMPAKACIQAAIYVVEYKSYK
jgi:hypothetical protein